MKSDDRPKQIAINSSTEKSWYELYFHLFLAISRGNCTPCRSKHTSELCQFLFTTGAVAFSFSHFDGGTGGIFLDDLRCFGSESRLLDCVHPAIGLHNCNHNTDAGVRCQGIVVPHFIHSLLSKFLLLSLLFFLQGQQISVVWFISALQQQ